jgi:hypothetical protein
MGAIGARATLPFRSLPLTFLVMLKYPLGRAQDDTTNTIRYVIVVIDEYDLSSLG